MTKELNFDIFYRKTASKTKTIKKCNCLIEILMQKGCVCGGI